MEADRARDGCIVETAPLAAMLCQFVDRWHETRPPAQPDRALDGAFVKSDRDDAPLSAYTFLALKTGLPEGEIKKVRNPRRNPTTELRVADALVGQIGEPGMFRDGTLRVMRNPRARPEDQAECCTGSEDQANRAALGKVVARVGSSSSRTPRRIAMRGSGRDPLARIASATGSTAFDASAGAAELQGYVDRGSG